MVGFLQDVRHELFLFLLFVLRTQFAFGKACGPSEYKSAAGECCPMCNIGSVVHRDCSGDFSTTCKPCTPGTFISEPNGLHKCFTCRNCVESQGLYIQHKCTTIEDTICGILDEYYCIDYSNLQCSHAQKHSVCKPGQETKTPGTKTSDAVCVDCPHGFYSPSGLNCTKWTDCSARNEIETENGSSVKDVTCTTKKRERYGLIFAIVLTSLFYIILYIAPLSTSCKLKYPIEETNPATQDNTAQPKNNTLQEG
ncbi:tumor necrosis factor receptor superfamily member 14-like isoform X3 [Carassius auratus]|uniref:Tumor necrosis factor receptor superfamily member 14-like isoform X3 n=1 Tax=Carassius auratus TaxID=7957 RepID=A0A6P6PMF1_CARAU|nr:tumor necrosis factor receptor superfamily member 14-like isoform X3 [Carassius auratus]